MSTSKLPNWCAKALRYYVGEERAYPIMPVNSAAYNTLNVLFFKEMESENARTQEKNLLSAEILDEKHDALLLCADLLAAVRHGGQSHGRWETVYRVSRQADVAQMKRTGMTVSFTSTCKGGFLKDYAKKKEKLVLLEFRVPPDAPRADMEELLKKTYPKPEEAEVLLPPWMPVEWEQVELSDEEKRELLDMHGKPPEAKYIVTVGEHITPPRPDPDIRAEWTSCAAGQRVIEALNSGKSPDRDDENEYIAWKERFQKMVAKLAFCVRLGDALNDELEECRYITDRDMDKDYDLDRLFEKDRAEQWIRALLGIKDKTGFAERIHSMTEARLIHTISTYLLGCYIQKNLLLSFDKLPRIFSKKTTGGAFSFFWSLACLCHDMGYAYEKEDGHRAKRGQMLTSVGRKDLLKLEYDLLDMTEAEIAALKPSDAEREWIKSSLDLVRKYNEYRVECHKLIDHGIAGGLILFDYAKRIAQPKPHAESRVQAATRQTRVGQMDANRSHSRFTICCLIIALTVARHNVWTANTAVPKNKKTMEDYLARDLSKLIVKGEENMLTMQDPLDQMLYMLEYMDTIDPIKAFYTRAAEDHKGDADLRKAYLLNHVFIRCDHCTGEWQNIYFILRKPDFTDTPDPVQKYLDSICGSAGGDPGIDKWLKVKEDGIVRHEDAVSLSFPVLKRTCKPNKYDIKEEEIMDLCLYQGSGDTVRPGLFYQIPNAYQTFNLLMMRGMEGEKVRIGIEKQRPYGVYIRDWRRTRDVFKSVFTAQCKYCRKMTAPPDKLKLMRCDRWLNTNMMLNEQHRTFAYTSTSKAQYLEEFAMGKKDKTFLECSLEQKVPMADYEAILGDSYAFMDEAEVLLPPFLGVEGPRELTMPFTAVEDSEDEPPRYFKVTFGGMAFRDVGKTKEELRSQREDLEAKLDANRDKVAEILDGFREDPASITDSCPEYEGWKKNFQELIELELAEIWNDPDNGVNTDRLGAEH